MSKRAATVASEAEDCSEGGPTTKRRSVQDSPTSSSSSSSDDTSLPVESASTSGGGGSGSRGDGARMGGAPFPMRSQLAPLAALAHAAAEEQGARPYMEDAHAALELHPGARSYAVFDGHGGAHVAEFCADRLLPRLRTEARPRSSSGGGAGAGAGAAPGTPSYPASLRAAFAAVDSELVAGRRAHVCGSTAAVCVVTEDWLYAGNCGDSRVVLVRSDKPLPLTIDHAPTRQDERERVQRAGGQVVWQNGFRVMGALSMTRAIGDHFLRGHGVIPDPEVSAVRRGPTDEFLILATDGLWNWVTPCDASDVTRRAAARAEAAGLGREAGAGVAARALTRLALARGSSDNVTVLIVDLRPPSADPPTPSSAAPAPAAPSLLNAFFGAPDAGAPEADAWAIAAEPTSSDDDEAAAPTHLAPAAAAAVAAADGARPKWESPFGSVAAQGAPFASALREGVLAQPGFDTAEEPAGRSGEPECSREQRPRSAAAPTRPAAAAGVRGSGGGSGTGSSTPRRTLVRALSEPAVQRTVTTGGCICAAAAAGCLGLGCGAPLCAALRLRAARAARAADAMPCGGLFAAALGMGRAASGAAAATATPAAPCSELSRSGGATTGSGVPGALQRPGLLGPGVAPLALERARALLLQASSPPL